MRACCHNCRLGEFSGSSPTGWCRMSPPVALWVEGDFASVFPKVAHDDWCGEFQPVTAAAPNPIEAMAPVLEPFLAVAAAMEAESAEILLTTDLTDANGDPLNLSSGDFLDLAAGWVRARGA